MAGKCLKSDSKFGRKKYRKRLPGEVDRLSELPDEILVAILSSLQLKEAVTTSVLSRRWSDLWKHTPNLDFDLDVKECKQIEIVNSVLPSHKAPSLKQFRISLYVDKSAQREITKWLEFVFSRQVENLELDFLCWEEMRKVVLQKSLRESSSILGRHQTLMISLKTLRLSCVKLSGEDLELFLRNCPLLERLSVSSATLTSDVEIFGMLKQLEIACCSGERFIKISAPNLTWIRVDDTSGKLLFENVPELVEADFISKSPSRDDIDHFASSVFCFISQLENLNLTLRYPKEFLGNEFPQMPNLKKLVVVYNGLRKHDLRPVTSLIWACPRLEEFRIECKQYVSTSKHLTAYMEEVTRKVERSPHRNLKVFQLIGLYKGADAHIEIVKYILDNCAALEKIIVTPPQFSFLYPLRRYDLRAEAEAARDYAKQQLQGKVPHHIQLHFD